MSEFILPIVLFLYKFILIALYFFFRFSHFLAACVPVSLPCRPILCTIVLFDNKIIMLCTPNTLKTLYSFPQIKLAPQQRSKSLESEVIS